ncbi:MAG: hypothetical protein Kow0063_42500 [Anaerolineae bacterium]
MTDLLTTRQLQEILKVDRTTIYRMIEKGRLPAVKVGNQWRFPRQAVEDLLSLPIAAMPQQADVVAKGQITHVARILPLECVQLIQDAFAEVLGTMIVITDMQGAPVTRISHPCGLYAALQTMPTAKQLCRQTWLKVASSPSIEPQFVPCHLGLLCARGLVRIGNELQAAVVLGGIAPETWPPPEEKIAALAEEMAIDPAVLQTHIREVFYLDTVERRTLLTFVQRIADIIAYIGNERSLFLNRLRNIAELTSL